jgi:Flp pilus assembly protein TadD
MGLRMPQPAPAPSTGSSTTSAGAPRTSGALSSARSPWIGGPWLDLCLILGVPLFLLPLILLAPGRPDVQELILYLGAFGALGHHLPGMLRAYGDRALFQRFRARLIVAPIFLVTVCVGFSVSGLGGIVLATFLWTTWHTLMQIFGFARIYDAKWNAGRAPGAAFAAERWTGRLDQLLCIAWIGAPLVWSDSRVGYALELYYRCGLPHLPTAALDGARHLWLAATLVVSALFLAQLVWSWSRGRRPSVLKLSFFAASFGFWWFCMVEVEHIVAGVALFDVFHDVQYLAIVWLFQRSRAEQAAADGGVTGFTRFLFLRSGALRGVFVGLYAALVVGYGSLGYFTGLVSSELVRQVLLGVLAASALFHFYLDGFIWKVRESGTRASLDLPGDPAAPARPWRWTQHAWKWAFFVLPVAWFAHAERALAQDSDRESARWRAWIAEAAPQSAEALTGLGVELAAAGDLARATEFHRRATELKPGAPEPHNNLGVALRLSGDAAAARAEFETALRLRPTYARAHGHLANLLMQQGEPVLAEEHFRAAARHDPRYADARANLALLLSARGDLPAALELLREALAIDPDHRAALNNLAWTLATTSRAELRSPREAVELARRLDQLTGHGRPQALDTLAAAEAACGRFELATEIAERAAALAREQGKPDLAEQIASRLDGYRSGRDVRRP